MFFKGRNIGNNIRLILDILDHTDANNILGVILLLDTEKSIWQCKSWFPFWSFETLQFWW